MVLVGQEKKNDGGRPKQFTVQNMKDYTHGTYSLDRVVAKRERSISNTQTQVLESVD